MRLKILSEVGLRLKAFRLLRCEIAHVFLDFRGVVVIGLSLCSFPTEFQTEFLSYDSPHSPFVYVMLLFFISFDFYFLFFRNLLCKAERQYLLTCKVSRYCLLALHGTTVAWSSRPCSFLPCYSLAWLVACPIWFLFWCHCISPFRQ